ncbi:unnamed protein product [Schistocephalus solidus]|uniref:Uncharacterized protein n=1 Tax=Schistocephalus solidus TaxID=70667 RepID=A0A183SI58_SCHSO|nr:unnamed protein product [Schistocephalus solidus]
MESPRCSPAHQAEDVQGRRFDDTPLWSGHLDHLLEPSKETEPVTSQLPPQNTEAEMARQDPGHGCPGVDRNPQHPRHAKASATAMERPPGENGRRVTTQTTFLWKFRCGWEDLAQDRPTWRRSVKTGSAIYETNRIAAAMAKRAAH